jgi:hypothetical protein
MIRPSASIVNRSSHPLEIFKMAHVQGGDCFCLLYLLILGPRASRLTLRSVSREALGPRMVLAE